MRQKPAKVEENALAEAGPQASRSLKQPLQPGIEPP